VNEDYSIDASGDEDSSSSVMTSGAWLFLIVFGVFLVLIIIIGCFLLYRMRLKKKRGQKGCWERLEERRKQAKEESK